MYDIIRVMAGSVGMLAFALLTFRLVSTWPHLSALGKVLGPLLAAFIVAVSLAQWRTATHGLDLRNELTIVILMLDWAAVLVALRWGDWIESPTSPFSREGQ